MRTMILGMLLLMLASASAAGMQPEPAKKQKAAAVDRYGDPLPEGAMGRLGTVRFRPGLGATVVAFSPDGKHLASSGRFVGVCFWNKETGQLLKHVPVDALAGSLCFSPDSSKVVSGRSVIDIRTMKEVIKFNTRDSRDLGTCAAFFPDGNVIATGGHGPNDCVIFWDAKTGKELRRTKGHGQGGATTSIAFSLPDGELLATANFDSTVRIWDSATGKQLHRLEGHGKPVHAVAFARDGKSLASGGEDGLIRFWDTKSGKALHQIDPGQRVIKSIAFSPDGKRLASGGLYGMISLWNPETRQEIHRCETDPYNASSLAFSPDGKTLASTGGAAIRRWSVETGKELSHGTSHNGYVELARFARDGKSLISFAGDHKIIEWDLLRNKESDRRFGILTPPKNTEIWASVDFSADGDMVAQVSWTNYPKRKYDPVIRLWDTANAKQIRVLEGHQDRVGEVKFSPDNKLLGSRGTDGIRIWNVAAGRELHHFLKKFDATALAFSPDSKSLAGAGRENMIHLWDLATGKEIRSWNSGQQDFRLIEFASDGKFLVTSDENQARVWEVGTGKEISRIESTSIYSLAVSPSGRVLATTSIGQSGAEGYDLDSSVQIWEMRTGQRIRRIETPKQYVICLAFSPNSQTLASGSSDSTILLWDLTGHAGAKPTPPDGNQLDALWSDLAADAKKADRAHWTLSLSPQQSLPFLKERLRTAVPADAELIARLLADLASANLKDRQDAERELVALGESAERALRKRLDSGPTLELRRRIEQVLAKREPDALRQLRAIDVLREIANPQACEVLESLAKSTPHPRVAQSASAALGRP